MLGRKSSLVASVAAGLLLLIGAGRAGSTPDAMSAADARRAVLARDFRIVTKTQEIPEPVRVLLSALTKTEAPVLAEPGGQYQETDVIQDPALPFRRLNFAGNGKGIYFVHYEKGGIGHSWHLAVFEFVPGRVSLVWRAVLGGRADNLEALREFVRKGLYRDDPSYGF